MKRSLIVYSVKEIERLFESALGVVGLESGLLLQDIFSYDDDLLSDKNIEYESELLL